MLRNDPSEVGLEKIFFSGRDVDMLDERYRVTLRNRASGFPINYLELMPINHEHILMQKCFGPSLFSVL